MPQYDPDRIRRQQEREAERARKAMLAREREREREQKQAHIEARKAEVVSENAALERRLSILDGLLTDGMKRAPAADFTLARRTVSKRPVDLGSLKYPAREPIWEDFEPHYPDFGARHSVRRRRKRPDTNKPGSNSREHRLIEQTFADLIDGPLAHPPSGRLPANAAWLTCAGIAHNLLRAAGTLASARHARATGATLRRQLINVPARTAHRARKTVLHPPAHWPWAEARTAPFTATHAPPAAT